MKAPRTINRESGGGAARFRGVIVALPPKVFGGAVGGGLGELIGRRWGLSASRPPSRARRSFLKRKRQPLSLSRPRERAITQANYKLFATLRLAVELRPQVSTFGAAAAAHHLHAAAPSLSLVTQTYGSGGRDTERLTRESSATFRLLGGHVREVVRRTDAERTLSFYFAGGGPAGALVAAALRWARLKGRAPRAPSGAHAALPPLRLPGALLRQTRFFLGEQLIHPAPRQSGVGVNFIHVPSRGAFVSVRPATRNGVAAGSHDLVSRYRATTISLGRVLHQGVAAWRTLLSSPSSARADAQTDAQGRHSPATIQLTFAAPKSPDPQAVPRGFSRIGPSPPMLYARQGASHVARGVAEALRDLRQSIGEVKGPSAPPAPQQVEQLTRQVLGQLERELRIEKERRGR